uniref:Myb-like domain-containing protein n=1 Tax=Anopheles maculatus TaxID=74869 RepID=A0A182SYC5_9DIPT
MDDKDALYAFNYYEKVEETLLASGRADLLERFEQILRNFNEIDDRVSLLYYQIEDLLGESFPQLVDMFLTFLLPGQAAQVGKFFEHFILTNMSDFLEKLNVFFAKQPAQIKKIHACLNELSNEPEVTMEQVKLKVLPLLKGSTLLTEWFLQLFPGERPPESPVSDYEHIAMKKHPTNDSYDAGSVYEHVSFIETLPEGPENPCASNGIRYIQGRIFQGALPARLTFLANSCVTRTINQPSEEPVTSNGDNLCDDSTLMAHAIRLNPLVHCPKGITYADVAHLLGERNGESEVGSSPDVSIASANVDDDSKAGTTSKKLTPKLPLKKRFNSPIARKAGSSPGDEKSSPGSGNKEVTAVTTTTSTTTPKKNTTSSVPVTIPPDSKALASARRLKTLLEAPQTPSSSQEEQKPDDPCLAEQQGNVTERVEISSEQPVPTTPTEETNCSVNVAVVEPQQPKPPAAATEGNPTTTEAPSWTREEDKIILQDIVKGFSSVDTFVRQIEVKIPDRTSEQIKSRFEFLLRMLRQVNRK